MDLEEQKWLKRAKEVQLKVNFGWLMQLLLIPLVLLSTCCAILVITLRFFWLAYNPLIVLSLTVVVILIVLIFIYIKAKSKFESIDDSLVRIESYSNLNSSLTAARQKITHWPEVPAKISAGIRLNFTRLFLPIIGAFCLLLVSFKIPIEPHVPKSTNAIPRSWVTLGKSLTDIEEKDLIQKKSIEEIRKKLEELKHQPESEWYNHSTMEATDNLRKNFNAELNNLSSSIDKAAQSLNTLQEQSENLNQAQRSKWLNNLKSALNAVEKAQMQPNTQLLEQLKKLNPDDFTQLSQQENTELLKQMNQLSEELKMQLRNGLEPGEQLNEEQQENMAPG